MFLTRKKNGEYLDMFDSVMLSVVIEVSSSKLSNDDLDLAPGDTSSGESEQGMRVRGGGFWPFESFLAGATWGSSSTVNVSFFVELSGLGL